MGLGRRDVFHRPLHPELHRHRLQLRPSRHRHRSVGITDLFIPGMSLDEGEVR